MDIQHWHVLSIFVGSFYMPNGTPETSTLTLSEVLLPHRSNAARVSNMAIFVAGKLPGNSKTVSKSEEINPLMERKALNVEYLWMSSHLFSSDFIYELRSVNTLNCYRFSSNRM